MKHSKLILILTLSLVVLNGCNKSQPDNMQCVTDRQQDSEISDIRELKGIIDRLEKEGSHQPEPPAPPLRTIEQWKNRVDSSITYANKSGSITPYILGTRLKELADLLQTTKNK